MGEIYRIGTPNIMLIFTEATPPQTNPLIQAIVIEQKVEAPVIVEIKDPNGCEPAMYWAKEAPYYCIPKPVATTARVATKAVISAQNASSEGNGYSYGYCTYLAKQMRPDLPNNLGNANTWYARYTGAKGSVPAVGAIGVAKSYTHVVYITAVNGDTVTVKEANYVGFNIISTRTTSANEFLYLY